MSKNKFIFALSLISTLVGPLLSVQALADEKTALIYPNGGDWEVTAVRGNWSKALLEKGFHFDGEIRPLQMRGMFILHCSNWIKVGAKINRDA